MKNITNKHANNKNVLTFVVFPSVSDFKHIRETTNAICQKAIKIKLDCSANLMNLHCIRVVWCFCDDGDYWWQIEIERASPHDYRLHAFVRDQLALQGITANIITEW